MVHSSQFKTLTSPCSENSSGMANAYACLISLINTIKTEQTPRPHPPIPFSQSLIDALLEKVGFLVDFLEGDYCKAADQHLLDRIAELAYAAEDAIEIPIVDQIQSQIFTKCSSSSTAIPGQHLDLEMERIIQDLDSIKAEVMLLIQDKRSSGIKPPHLPQISSKSTTSSSAAAGPRGVKIKMVGLEEEKRKVMEQLAGNQSCRQVIPIVGAGGIGKTTLARNVFDDKFTAGHFDIRVWLTISQEYNVKEIFTQVLSSLKEQGKAEMYGENLDENVYKSLSGRRYIVIFDDIWSIDVWNKIQRFFPDNANGSRIMITTRLSNLSEELSSFSLAMKYLDDNDSWSLLCEKVFGQRSCPVDELEEVGKMIVNNCRGLPLAIVVIGGLLANSKTFEYWKQISDDFSTSSYLTDDEQCSKILSLSYNHLSAHLKPCFLYLGVFPENHKIRVTQLTRLWVAEGFLKPIRGKQWEEIAEVYLKELIERNLIMVSREKRGKIDACTIHDLLRELCLKEAQKEKFLCLVNADRLYDPPSLNCHRRLVISPEIQSDRHLMTSLGSVSCARSLILWNPYLSEMQLDLGSHIFKLLRVLASIGEDDLKLNQHHISEVSNLINLRHLAFSDEEMFDDMLAPNIGLFRNLQVLRIELYMQREEAVSEFWDLPQLFNVKFIAVSLPEPPSCQQDQHDNMVLDNLQSLRGIVDFSFGEAVLKRILNVKELEIFYTDEACKQWSSYSARNLECLQKLESFKCSWSGFSLDRTEFRQNIAFPQSLKKLVLCGCQMFWEDMSRIGSLPHLEVLKLKEDAFIGPEWNPVEGEFCCLKFLSINAPDLVNWNANSDHFPCLEQLMLPFCRKLKEIPSDIGEIPTLRLIQLRDCSISAMKSAKAIAEEQHRLENNDLLVKVDSLFKVRSIHDSDPAQLANFIAQSVYVTYKDDAMSGNEDEECNNE